MALCTLPLEMIVHIFQYLAEKDKLAVVALQNKFLNNALDPNTVVFYNQVYKYFPCGQWYSPGEQKFYDVELLPGPAIHINYYPIYTKKQMYFNKIQKLHILKTCYRLKKNEEFYVHKSKSKFLIKDKSLFTQLNEYNYKYKNEVYRHVKSGGFLRTNACIDTNDKNQVVVKLYNRNLRYRMRTYIFENNKLVSKKVEAISSVWMDHFYNQFEW